MTHHVWDLRFTPLINRTAQRFAKADEIGKIAGMTKSPAELAMARLEAALARIEAARDNRNAKPADSAGSARVMALVNSHEKLREEVADTIGELDALIEELEG